MTNKAHQPRNDQQNPPSKERPTKLTNQTMTIKNPPSKKPPTNPPSNERPAKPTQLPPTFFLFFVVFSFVYVFLFLICAFSDSYRSSMGDPQLSRVALIS
eukprot:c15849_g1_i1.p1 GENE.c15849_g1_i1~~c15849_g1_i1.p1  ORF type:complete len:107 (-),score=26.42 c15849_g1_i1:52-351(-)